MGNLLIIFLVFVVLGVLLVMSGNSSSSHEQRRRDMPPSQYPQPGYASQYQTHTPRARNESGPSIERFLGGLVVVGLLVIVAIGFIVGMSLGVSAGPGW